MKVNDYEALYCTKFQVYAANIGEAISKNRVISAFLVSELHVADTVET